MLGSTRSAGDWLITSEGWWFSGPAAGPRRPGRRHGLHHQAAAQGYAWSVTLHVGATWEEWRAEDQPALDLAGALTVLADGAILLDVGDGEPRPLADLLVEHWEARRDAMGDRFVGRVRVRVGLLATPVAPPGWVDAPPDADGPFADG